MKVVRTVQREIGGRTVIAAMVGSPLTYKQGRVLATIRRERMRVAIGTLGLSDSAEKLGQLIKVRGELDYTLHAAFTLDEHGQVELTPSASEPFLDRDDWRWIVLNEHLEDLVAKISAAQTKQKQK
jgi:hypothetical protein